MQGRSEAGRALNEANPSEFDRLIGQRIRWRRVELDLTQTQLGTAIGVSFQQVQKYERGLNRVSASRLCDLTRALDIDVSYFLDVPNQSSVKGKTNGLTTLLRDSDCLRLISAFERIADPALRKAIVHLIEAVG